MALGVRIGRLRHSDFNPLVLRILLSVQPKCDTTRPPRVGDVAYRFLNDVASRIQFVDPSRPLAEQHRVQLTTDGARWYRDAVERCFGANVDYATQQKEFGGQLADKSAAARYSPSRITNVTTEVIKGSPNPRHISTSFVERQNWTVRTNLRRYSMAAGVTTRLFDVSDLVALLVESESKKAA
jgi:hypothetical protein